MPVIARVFNVAPGGGRFLYKYHQDWRVTALIAKGTSFRVRMSDGTHETDDLLLNEANLNTSLFLDNAIYLVFQNDSSKNRAGFFCGEV